MANTLNPEKLAAHKDMLLSQYMEELRRLAGRVQAAQERFNWAKQDSVKLQPVSHHDPHNMANVVSELSRLAGAIELLETVERSLE